MMEMAKEVTCCFFTLLLTLTSVSAIQRLDSIRDLKRINFGRSVPEHSLVLLYWFAHSVIIEGNDHIRLTFNPSKGDYGAHQYYNLENLLGRLSPGQQYYTIGNTNQPTSVRLPRYVLDPPANIEAGNMDRIIIRVRGTVIDEVYLTQHSHNLGRSYDPNYTFQITTNLLRHIQEFPMGGNYHTLVNLRDRYGSNADVFHVSNSLGELACLGLFLCIVLDKQIFFREQIRRPENRNNYELNQNERSGSDHTSGSQNDDCCMEVCNWLLALVIVVFIIFIILYSNSIIVYKKK